VLSAYHKNIKGAVTPPLQPLIYKSKSAETFDVVGTSKSSSLPDENDATDSVLAFLI
jgi:hypothetical protein